MAIDRDKFWNQFNDQVTEVRNDARQSAELDADDAAWDGTLMDGVPSNANPRRTLRLDDNGQALPLTAEELKANSEGLVRAMDVLEKSFAGTPQVDGPLVQINHPRSFFRRAWLILKHTFTHPLTTTIIKDTPDGPIAYEVDRDGRRLG